MERRSLASGKITHQMKDKGESFRVVSLSLGPYFFCLCLSLPLCLSAPPPIRIYICLSVCLSLTSRPCSSLFFPETGVVPDWQVGQEGNIIIETRAEGEKTSNLYLLIRK